MAMTPGWYPDPFSSAGYVRWWDGARWGASVLLPEGTPPPVPGQPVALPPPGSTPMTAPSVQAAPPAPVPPAGGYPPPPAGWAPPPYGAPAPGGYGAPAEAPYEIAAYGSRVLARIIDSFIEGLVLVPFSLWLLWPALTRYLESLPSDGSLPPEAFQQWLTDVAGVSLLLNAVTLLVTFAYEVPQNVRWGQTLGKRAVGIRVRPRDLDRVGLSWGTASIRWAVAAGGAALVGGVFTIVDYLWPLWDKPWRQTIHDKAAKTTVVPQRRKP